MMEKAGLLGMILSAAWCGAFILISLCQRGMKIFERESCAYGKICQFAYEV